MSRIDFYILPEDSYIRHFACSMTAKTWGEGNRVHIHTSSEQNANSMDDLLWTFRDISFIPHEILEKESTTTPVTIGFGSNFPKEFSVIINLDDSIPSFISNFDRVVEIVGNSEDNRRLARKRYRQYRDDAFEIHDHQIDKIT